MKTTNTKIVVIHDGLIPEIDPLLVELQNKFGIENIIHFIKSDDGLKYVLDNLKQKMVVLLDLNFPNDELPGTRVFDKIREKTALVNVIIMTASELNDIKREDLIDFINNDAIAFMSSTDSTENFINMIEKSSHQLEVRVASAMEQWICGHTEAEKNEPYVIVRDGKSYSLNQILEEIRQQTDFGMEMEKNMLLLAIDMLSRGKKKIDG